ncbi:MAG TPA: hypothetical protein VMF35_12170 [Acidimicrobiales bacterium]|nr:hypothetical protein [Acidimicrobiales bacterium]
MPEPARRLDAHPSVTAVVLTYRRPRLAGDVVRTLVHEEGLPPGRIVLVVNGEGGLDDPELEAAVRTVRLPVNIGPAGGFRAGLEAAFSDSTTAWAYLCEDDVGVFELPAPRVAAVLDRLRHRSGGGGTAEVGAVVAYGRRFDARGHAANVVPDETAPPFVPVDVAAWGATLVARAALERGVLPATQWFFGFEDFDFFLRLRAAGLGVLLDTESARAVARVQTSAGREAVLSPHRPGDAEEPWRAYYVARNYFHLARAHGSASWQAWHLAYSARRVQRASSNAERVATLHGLVDGVRRRWGPHPRYVRTTAERNGSP